ncbi:hypothetical protein [Candidatus Stoquefichus massiliensis]|uniref:hypothetical protein n=1 Tax=Candidatus Stoquefichus massiliensis TaxID=1470350 RepID=UPI0004B23E54|nr:hypothetical protein [Candidatus Stoquefichus massiliensis]
MITTTQTHKDQILSDERQLRMKIIFNGRQEIDGHSLKNVTIHEVSNGKDTLTLGSICSNSIQLTMSYLDNIQYMNSSLEVFIGLMIDNDIEWIPMGTYIVSEVSQDNQYEVKLEGYDFISNLNIDYQPQIEYPAPLKDVVHDIVQQCHITLKSDEFEDIMIDKPLDVSCKEMLSYMASLLGQNVRMNRYNQLEFFWYESSDYVIEEKDQYQGGFKKTNTELMISSLTSGDEENVLTCGSGYGITFDNPYMTQERLEKIFEKINGFTYLPCTCTWRGDPSIEVSDLIRIDNHNIVIMDNTMSFDGGMKSSIESLGQNEKEVVMSKSPSEILLKKFYRTLLNSYKDISENILGHKGGYYTVDMDENGYPKGWTIMDTPTLRDDTHLWRMSMGGFGYSEDGGKTFRNFAFDLKGNFSANAINTGQLSGDMFELDLEQGTVKFGMRDNEGHINEPFLSMDQEGLKIDGLKEIHLAVQNIENEVNQISNSLYKLNIVGNGNVIKNESDNISLNAQLFYKGEDITEKSSELLFNWTRESENKSSDTIWNNAHKGMKNVVITCEDVDKYAVFSLECCVLTDVIKETYMTIIDETDIPKLSLNLDSNMPTQQVDTNGNIWPIWNPLIITPDIRNNANQIMLNDKNLDITYKRIVDGIETDLCLDNEVVENHCLKVSGNVLSSIDSRNIIYKCYVIYKGYEISQQLSFSLVRDGQQGQQGISGTTYYTWIMYADNENGTGISNEATNKNYIGIAYNKTQETPSIDPSQYRWAKIKGEQGIQGPKGENGRNSYFHVKYSQNVNGNPMSDSAVDAIYIGVAITENSTAPTNYTSYSWSKMKGEVGPKGETGTAGPKGSDGKTSYLHIKYSDNGTTFTSNNGETPGKYIGTYVDFTETDSSVFNDYTWVKVEGPQGVQGPKGTDGKQYYTWLKYADTPTTGMSDNPTGKAYIGLAYNKETSTESNNYSDYTWSLIKGEKGDQGVAGGKGADGKTFYTWIKYATSSLGANMSDDPTGKTYIGLAYNKTTPTESTNAADYTWSLIKGDKGDAGKGIKSITNYYLATASSSGITASTSGWTTSVQSVSSSKKYLWNYEVITYTDNSTTASAPCIIGAYGDTGPIGAPGATGVGISTITEYYQVSTSNIAAPASWATAVPTLTETNKYLWNYEVIKYTNNTTKETAKRVIGVYGNKGNTGATGPQGAIGESLGQGKILFKDSTFIDEVNSIKVYNNSGNSNVVLERIARETDCPSASDYQIRIKNIGTSSPGCGGFYWGHASRANAVFIYRIIAKIPAGRKLLWATNATGTGGNTKWLTSNTGTGKYEEYIFKLVCGNTGTFSSTGFFYIDGTVGTTDVPVYWYIAYATCFDMTDIPVDVEELIARAKVEIRTQYDTDIELLQNSITAFVNENTVLKTDYNTKITEIINKMVLTKDYTEFIKSTEQTLDTLNQGKVNVIELLEWARFNGSTLELGASKSNFKAILTTSELGFYDSNTKIAWFSNQELHTVKALRIGSPTAYFRFIKEVNDSFSLE